MAKGNISGASAVSKAKGSGGDWGPDISYFNLKAGEAAVVRFLDSEEHMTWAWCHEMPAQGRQKFGDDAPCLDQEGNGSKPCPGCERGLDRYFTGYMPLVHRLMSDEDEERLNAGQLSPKFKLKQPPKFGTKTLTRKDGSEYTVTDRKTTVGTASGVFVFCKGIRMFEELAGKDATYRGAGGLPNIDFVIKREGSGGDDTKWHLDPLLTDSAEIVKGSLPEEEQRLVNEFLKEVDLDEAFCKPGTYAEMAAKLGVNVPTDESSNGGSSSDSPLGGPDPVDVSAFAATRGSADA